jgi:hypothetical protein
VIPEINGYTAPMKRSADWYAANHDRLTGSAVTAIMAAIAKDPAAMQAAAVMAAGFGPNDGVEQVAGLGAAGPKGS